ncbi:MAG: hypothetical protein ACREFQ_16335 [Stellaceae bacterium]
MDGKPGALTQVLLRKYGRRAVAVARDRARLHQSIHDCETAALWSAVAADARLCLASNEQNHSPTPERREPTLDELLDGTVTKRVMDAHGTDAKTVRAEIRRVARRRKA